MKTRRRLLLAGVGMLALPTFARPPAPPIAIEVWKSPTCGCCKDWVAHMEANGFRVQVHDVGNTAARARLGLAERFGSCHTARVGRYVVEGHVPAQDVLRLLRERPQGLGLAVPGMPVGSPGMDGAAYGNRRDPHDVLLVGADGRSSVFSSYFK
jgi:hypothetical protein